MARPTTTEIFAYLDKNPNLIYSSGYDDIISDKMANMILQGKFEEFSEEVSNIVRGYESHEEFWASWEQDFAREFGFRHWDDLPEDIQEIVEENRAIDESPWLKDAIRNWTGNIVATPRWPDAPEVDNLIYAPSNHTASDGRMENGDAELARRLIEMFEPEIETGELTAEEALRDKLEMVYGGYDRECLVLCGRLNLLDIYESGKAPTHVNIGPGDVDNLLFYEHFNGCGNMGTFKPGKEVTLPASYSVDGSHGYGVDSCYGFTGSWWRHEIRVAQVEEPEAELAPSM